MWGCVKRRAELAFRPRRPIAISPAKKILFAFVAAQGFRELRAAMKDAAAKGAGGPGALSRRGVAYIQFAAQNCGLFRVMFGEILVEREKYPVLDAAVSAVVSDFLVRDKHSAAVTAWGLIHGLAHLVIDGFIPASQARTMAEKCSTGRARQGKSLEAVQVKRSNDSSASDSRPRRRADSRSNSRRRS